MKGIVTVEAAFVFPFVICVIMAVIWLTFFMFGKVGAMCDCDRLLLEEERVYRDTGHTDNVTFFGNARRELTGYPLTSCIVSRCYGEYGELLVEYVLESDTVGSVVPDGLSKALSGDPVVRKIQADNRIDRARYISVGKSIYTKVKGYARGWRNGD